jgi:hypothetical protein
MQDFAARLQRPFELRLFFHAGNLALLRDSPQAPGLTKWGQISDLGKTHPLVTYL